MTEKFRDCDIAIFFFQAEDGIRDWSVTGVQTCALPISQKSPGPQFAPLDPGSPIEFLHVARFKTSRRRKRPGERLRGPEIEQGVRLAAKVRRISQRGPGQLAEHRRISTEPVEAHELLRRRLEEPSI